MKSKEVKELTNKTKADLKKMLDEMHLDLSRQKMDLKLGKGKNTAVLKEIKRDIARVLTVLKQKEVENNG